MADIVEVTHCGKCQFFRRKGNCGDEEMGACEMHNGTFMFGCDFCSYGKPRKERKYDKPSEMHSVQS